MLLRVSLVLAIGFISLSSAQEWSWERNDELLNPYGIHTKGMNTPNTGDFDDDGDIDLIVGCKGGVVQYYENIGTPDSAIWRMDDDYFASLDIDTSLAPQPSLVDLDNDGVDELYMSGSRGGLNKYINTGSEENPIWLEDTLWTNDNYSGLTSHQFIDYNFDGDFDLIMTDGESEILYFENTGDANNPEFIYNELIFESLELEYGGYLNCRLADIYGDDKLEIFIILGAFDIDAAEVYYYTNNGTLEEPIWVRGQFSYYTTNYFANISFSDFDNDEDLDILIGNYQVPLFYNENIGTSDSIVVAHSDNGDLMGPLFINWGDNICFVDYDNDQDFDFTYLHYYHDYWYSWYHWSSSINDGTYNRPIYDFYQGFVSAGMVQYLSNIYLTAGDLNGDNYPELVTHIPAYRFYENINGNGFHYDNVGSLDLDIYYCYPELGDFDDDGLNDILVRLPDSLEWMLYKNVGTPNVPFWEAHPEWLPDFNTPITKCRAANINRDNKIDLIGVDSNWRLQGYINTGSDDDVSFAYVPEIFAEWQDYIVRYYDCVDIDGDGDDDILANQGGIIEFIENKTPAGIVENEIILPNSFALEQNYPNPFNASTMISFNLQNSGNTTLSIYDLLGRKVAVILDKNLDSGRHSIVWDGISKEEEILSSGVYFYRLTVDNNSITRKMTFIK